MAMSTNGESPSATTIERGNKLLAEMESFATGAGCRRRSLLKYFGEDMGETDQEGRAAHMHVLTSWRPGWGAYEAWKEGVDV